VLVTSNQEAAKLVWVIKKCDTSVLHTRSLSHLCDLVPVSVRTSRVAPQQRVTTVNAGHSAIRKLKELAWVIRMWYISVVPAVESFV
jgi:hypothetical protein